MSDVLPWNPGVVDRKKVQKVAALAQRYRTQKWDTYKKHPITPLAPAAAINKALAVLDCKLNPAEYEAVLDRMGVDL